MQRPRSERVIKRQNETLAFAIGHCRRVSHRRGYFITYGERTGRYLDVQSSTGFTSPGDFQRFQKVPFSRERPRVVGIRRDLDS